MPSSNDPDTRELNPQEADALTEDLQAVLKKHNAELSVVSSIRLLRYVKSDAYAEPEQAQRKEEEIEPAGSSN